MPLTIQNRRLFLILITASAILVLPLVAMQFSKEVKWTASDFAVAGLLLFGTGFLIQMALRKTKKGALRILVVLGVLLWNEPFPPGRAAGYAIIGCALLAYGSEAALYRRRRGGAAA